jgi:ABC-type amino acid transport substrate-binding protein
MSAETISRIIEDTLKMSSNSAKGGRKLILKPTKSLFIILLMLISLGRPNADAQSDPVLKVGISPFSPFVFLTTGEPTGMSIDMWQALARHLDIKFEYIECKGVADKLKRLEEGDIDIAIGGITITEERESVFDFSHPTYETGLDILIPKVVESTLIGLITSLFTGQKMFFVGALLVLIIIAGHIIWLVERSSSRRRTSFHRNYFPGVFEGMYWALITASTIGYGDKVPQRWIGRILAAIIILMFLPLFGFFVAQLSSDLTMQSLRSNINGPQDLGGRHVAVVEGTTSFHYMKKENAYLSLSKRVEDAIESLLKGEVDAVVYDAPNLLYYAKGEGQDRVMVVGKTFEPQNYGLAVIQGNPLREKINRAILNMIESDELERIEAKWLGH